MATSGKAVHGWVDSFVSLATVILGAAFIFCMIKGAQIALREPEITTRVPASEEIFPAPGQNDDAQWRVILGLEERVIDLEERIADIERKSK